MINDEFNKIEITNDKSSFKKEFGKTQKVEFSSYRDNKVPSEEFNKKIKFNTHPNHTNIEIKDKAQDITKAVKVTSVNAANSIGAATASVATVGAVVAVTAISVVTGISVALHDYDFKFNSFTISSNEVIYDLFIIDNKQSEEERNYEEIDYQRFEEEERESGDFSLRVYNANYDYTNTLWLGSNYGSFVGLTLGETYNIVLSENRYGGETLFEESFTTYQLSRFNSFEIYPDANFVANTISIYLDYLDEAETLSDFNLNLSNETQPDGMVIPLEKKNGLQEVSLPNLSDNKFDLTQPCYYEFSYKNKGKQEIFKRGNINFYNTATEKSEFYQFIFDGSANFITEEFYVCLKYVDDLNIFSDFILSLSNEDMEFEIDIPLERTTDQQTIDTQLYDIGLSNTYTYRLICRRDGEEIELDSGSVTFYDISGGKSEFNGIVINEDANFLTKTFTVQLFYQDDFGYYYGFRLIFDDEIEFALEETTDLQTIDCSGSSFDFRVEHSYVLKCYNMGVEETLTSGSIFFNDNSGGVSTFYGLIFDQTADFKTRTFEIGLDYQDDFDMFSDFELTIYDTETKESSTFQLEKSNLMQQITIDEKTGDDYIVDIINHDLTYTFTYVNDGNSVTYREYEPLYFANSNPSTFTGIESPYIFVKDSVSSEYIVPLRFVFNDVMEIYNDFTVELYLDEEKVGYIDYLAEELKTDWMYGTLTTIEGYSLDSILSSNGQTKVKVIGSVYDERTHGDLSEEVLFEENIQMSKEEIDEVYGVKLDQVILLGSYETYITPIYVGASSNIECDIIFEAKSGNTYTYILSFDSYTQPCLISMDNLKEGTFDEDTFLEDFSGPVKVSLKYCTLTYPEYDGTSSDLPEPIRSEYKTIVCYDSYLFSLSA